MRTIAIVNQKGGCGKTLTAINLSAFLARAGRRVLLVDMDPQGHATLGLQKGPDPRTGTIADVLLEHRSATLAGIIRPVQDNLDLAPADILLSAVPETLAQSPRREHALATALDEVRGRYDYVLVDCPPHVGLLTFNALHACAEAIVPMDPSFFSLHGLGKVFETFDLLARHSGHTIVPRILVTLYAGRSAFSKAVIDDMRTHMPGGYFETIIRYSVKLAEAASHGEPIAQYCRHSVGYDDYAALAGEVLQQESPSLSETRRDQTAAVPAPAGPALTPDGVRFVLEAPTAARVQLVGDFNQWVIDGNEMEPAGSVWTKIVKLGPGRYRYRYVVDGQWQSDPGNGAIEPCPFGGHDSVLVLDGASAASGN